jgi:hypothetical protein
MMKSAGISKLDKQPTADRVRKAFEDAMGSMYGFAAAKSDSTDDRIRQFCNLRSERHKNAVLMGLDDFISGNDYQFIIDILGKRPPRERRLIIKRVCFLAFMPLLLVHIDGDLSETKDIQVQNCA